MKVKHAMSIIGTFERSGNCIIGTLHLASLNVGLAFQPTRHADGEGNRPAYEIFMGSYQLGSAWKQKSRETNRDYLSVKLDDPTFPAPIYAALFEREGGSHVLVWNRNRETAQ
jgi:uncharacterized protein (DUF736 family)